MGFWLGIEKIFIAVLDRTPLGKLKSLWDPYPNFGFWGLMAKSRKSKNGFWPFFGTKTFL
jgi:hypothetical protein